MGEGWKRPAESLAGAGKKTATNVSFSQSGLDRQVLIINCLVGVPSRVDEFEVGRRTLYGQRLAVIQKSKEDAIEMSNG
jgi:hypothetical protein